MDNAAFGYWKVTVERPLRIEGADPNRAYKAAEIKEMKESGQRNEEAPAVIRKIFYKPKTMRTMAEIRADILALDRETEGLLAEILGDGEPASTP